MGRKRDGSYVLSVPSVLSVLCPIGPMSYRPQQHDEAWKAAVGVSNEVWKAADNGHEQN